MTLSKQREAIVEEFLKSFPAEGGRNAFWRRTSEQRSVAQFILQYLNDYTESIVRMMEGMNNDDEIKSGVILGERFYEGFSYAIDQLLEELNK